jgi:hypothetical protein
MLSFSSDGMFAFIPDGDVGGFGTYEVDGQTITFVYTGGRFCSGGFVWNASLPRDGRLRAMNVSSSSPCEPERQLGLETTWTQVSPRSAAVEEITADVSPGVFRPLPPESGRSSTASGSWRETGSCSAWAPMGPTPSTTGASSLPTRTTRAPSKSTARAGLSPSPAGRTPGRAPRTMSGYGPTLNSVRSAAGGRH